MKFVISGGTGFLGQCLVKHFATPGNEVVLLVRNNQSDVTNGHMSFTKWDGKTQGPWNAALENADVLINLNGKSVDCRYTKKNMERIYTSRLNATNALGLAVLHCKNPPRLWLNAASATIYRHSTDKEMDEHTGEIGSGFSVDVCQKWEGAFNSFITPSTRKVLLRTGIVLGRNGGPMIPLRRLVRFGFGGKHGDGTQFCSWLHEDDFVNAVKFVIANRSLSGAINVTAPNPVTNGEFMATLRKVMHAHAGIPLPRWLLEIGAFIIRTETELLLKSRRVVPGKLADAGFKFTYTNVESAFAGLDL
jgi:uncharacterized protein (TIGR01777 family)